MGWNSKHVKNLKNYHAFKPQHVMFLTRSDVVWRCVVDWECLECHPIKFFSVYSNDFKKHNLARGTAVRYNREFVYENAYC